MGVAKARPDFAKIADGTLLKPVLNGRGDEVLDMASVNHLR
jgi:hypothetical protein